MSKAKPEKTVSEQVHALFATVCEEYLTAVESTLSSPAAGDSSVDVKKKTLSGVKRMITSWKKKLEVVYPVNGQTPLPGMDEPEEKTPEPPADVAVAPTSIYELAVVVRQNFSAEKLEKIVGAEKFSEDLEDSEDCYFFKFHSGRQALLAAKRVEAAGDPDILYFEVEPAVADVESEPIPDEKPTEPKDDQIELEVETGAKTEEEAADHKNRLEALVGRQSVDVVTDEDGTSVFFEYPDKIGADAGRSLAEEKDFVHQARIVDPHLERYSADEQKEILRRPRKLVNLSFGEPKRHVTRCTLCVDLEHVPDDSSVSAKKPDAICGFCGWRPEDDKEKK